MTWRVVWTPRALKDLEKLDRPVQERLLKSIERFAETGSGDAIRLVDIHPPEWRLRAGDWRVRFQQDPAEGVLWILRILPRDKAY
jgi:mRNA interferase RelE/StbE